MLYTETRTNEYSFIIQMSAAAAGCKFPTDIEKQEGREKGGSEKKKKLET